MNISAKRLAILWGVATSLAVVPCFAADKSAKDPAKKLQQQLRLAEQEKARLAQQVAAADGRSKELEAKVSEAQSKADVASGRIGRLSREVDALKGEVAASKAEQSSLTARLAEMEGNLAAARAAHEVEKRRLESLLVAQKSAFQGCSERNSRMYRLGNELLDRYEEKGCFSSLLQGEPFTGLKRAQIEKMVEEEREKLDENKLLSVTPAKDKPLLD